MTPRPVPGLSLDLLEHAIARPRRFEPHDAPFWDDPHIGRQMLAAHLDPGTDAASRRPEAIARTVDHLARVIPAASGSSLLDLGCGPGLYASAFAARGMSVTGIDLAPTSIGYACDAAAAAGQAIQYRLGDYTVDPLGGPFDAAILIYLDLGVLPDEPLDRLLGSIRGSLTPGGAFAFDVHALARRRVPEGTIAVDRTDGPGFWRAHPYLAIETTYRYGDDFDLNQHAVVDARGTTVYRVWDRVWSVTALRARLRRHGLRVDEVWSDLEGTPWRRSTPTLGVLARRPG